jgi:hypothetical protein
MPTLEELAAALPAAIALEQQARQLAEAQAVAKANEVTALALKNATLTAQVIELQRRITELEQGGSSVVRVGSAHPVKTLAQAAAKLGNGVTLELAGETFDYATNKLFVNTFNNVSIVAAPSATPVIRYTGTGSSIAIEHRGDGLTVKGITFDSATSLACEGVVSINGKNATVENCTGTERIRNLGRADGCDGFRMAFCITSALRKHLFVSDPRRVAPDQYHPEPYEPNANILIEGCVCERSLDPERAIRIQGAKGCIIRNNTLLNTNGSKDSVCIRDGDDVLLEDNDCGEVTIGVMGDGQGGINLPPGPARDFELAKRLTRFRMTGGSVKFYSSEWNAITLERGLVDGVIDGVKIDAGPNVGWIFRPDFDTPYEPYRPMPTLAVTNVAAVGTKRGLRFVEKETPGVVYKGQGNTLNGTAL